MEEKIRRHFDTRWLFNFQRVLLYVLAFPNFRRHANIFAIVGIVIQTNLIQNVVIGKISRFPMANKM